MSKPINIKDWSHGVWTMLDTNGKSLNVVLNQDGIVRPRKGWKTFAGMVYQLWLINQRYNKMGLQGDFTVRLPLKPGGFYYTSPQPKKGKR